MYADPDEVRDWLGVTDAKLDALIEDAVPAAEEWINGHCARSFDLQPTATPRYFDVAPDGSVYVDDVGNLADFALATDNDRSNTFSTSWAANDYQLLPLSRNYQVRPFNRITPTGSRWFPYPWGGYPLRSGLVRVTARWGWPAVPASVKQAAKQKAAQIVSRRNSPNGVAGFNDLGVVRVVMSDAQIGELLTEFRIVGIA